MYYFEKRSIFVDKSSNKLLRLTRKENVIKYFPHIIIGNMAQKFLPNDRKSLDYEGKQIYL